MQSYLPNELLLIARVGFKGDKGVDNYTHKHYHTFEGMQSYLPNELLLIARVGFKGNIVVTITHRQDLRET